MRTLGPNEILFIIFAVRWTILLSIAAFAGGAIGAVFIALARTSGFASLRTAAFCYIKLFQGTPLLMQLFLAFFVPGLFNISVDPWLAAMLGLSLNASAFLGEIWRGALESVPAGQSEAATALGLRYLPKMAFVLAPQAIRIAIPPTIGFMVQLVKGTSLASIIGFVELTRAAQVINNATFRPFTIFLLVALIYFLICWPLSVLARRLEKRLTVASR